MRHYLFNFKYLCWCTLLVFPSLLLAQRNSPIFSYVSKPSSLEEDMKALTGDKYETARAIYEALVKARGDRRYPAPPFLMTKDVAHGAYLAAEASSIVLEEKAYDICMSFGGEEGVAAVASLLGHELIHFYEKHQWRTSFVDEFRNELEVGRTLEDIVGVDKINNETQSDYLGGFLAYSAGYQVFKNRTALLDKIYQDYEIPEVDPSGRYPSLKDRKKLAVKSEEKLAQLVQLFEIANLLAAVGAYGNARAVYRHILLDYQSPQLYSNLGVVFVLEALELFPRSERKYRLPVELDFDFGAGGRDGFTEADKARRERLLRESILYFNNALALDSEYAPAYLNKACAYYMLDELPQAKFYAEVEAMRNPAAYFKTAVDAKVLLGMIQLKEGDEAGAIAALEKLASASSIADYNLRKLKSEPLPAGEVDEPEAWKIDDVDPGDLAYFPRMVDADESLELKLYGKLKVETWDGVGGLGRSVIIRVDPPKGAALFIHLTREGYEGETYDRFKVGAARAAIVDKYGEPAVSRALPNGEALVYEEVVFFMDAGQKLQRWANYIFD
ncbi:MAG: hypothetical protein GVY26_16660 [Bacteroidetes bacterium]|jgi:hypothetical protein|nr:hypothetical protein [Bacteroidota bacterium]